MPNLATILDPHPDDARALVSRGSATTYGELKSQVSAYAGGLRALGIEAGAPVGIVAGTNWYFAATYLAVLHAGGVALALDDFGAGYSSLSRLLHLPLQIVKVDRQFLRGVPENADATAVLA